MLRKRISLAASAVAIIALSGIALPSAQAATSASHRVVQYYQTQYPGGVYLAPPQATGASAGTTVIILAAVHLNEANSVNGTPAQVKINDNVPSASYYTQMWQDLSSRVASGVKVMAMLGGAGGNSYKNLQNDFDKYYGLLKSFISSRSATITGIDVDVEERASITNATVERLIKALRTDFGTSFTITMAPVPGALTTTGSDPLTGSVNYSNLKTSVGSYISWYNVQMYCGWGTMASTDSYVRIINYGYDAAKIVGGTYTNTSGCRGYVDRITLISVVKSLKNKYATFGGVAAWEYYNGSNSNQSPGTWAPDMKNAMA